MCLCVSFCIFINHNYFIENLIFLHCIVTVLTYSIACNMLA